MGIKDLFKGSAEGIISGVTNGAANIISKFKADPTKVVEFEKELEELRTNSVLKATEMANELEEAYLKDTQSARDTNAKIQESDKASFWAKNTGYFLDIFLGLIWGTVTVFLLARALHLAVEDVDMTAVLSIYSTVTALFMMSLQFHRGTSKGSEDKSKLISKHMMK